jgi:hypothetical protein
MKLFTEPEGVIEELQIFEGRDPEAQLALPPSTPPDDFAI